MADVVIISPAPRKRTWPAVAALAALLLFGSSGGWYYLYGPCGTTRVRDAGGELQAALERYVDAVTLAGSTSRIALAGPVADLQEIRRDTNKIDVPACLDQAQLYVVGSMDGGIAGFVAFMGQESESAVNRHFNNGRVAMENAIREIEAVGACAPFCPSP